MLLKEAIFNSIILGLASLYIVIERIVKETLSRIDKIRLERGIQIDPKSLNLLYKIYPLLTTPWDDTAKFFFYKLKTAASRFFNTGSVLRLNFT